VDSRTVPELTTRPSFHERSLPSSNRSNLFPGKQKTWWFS
jgi:hypothetical protein